MSQCERCGRETFVTTMSVFNTETICSGGDESCKSKERRHPKYEEAHRIESEAVRSGDYNFPGIGKPADL